MEKQGVINCVILSAVTILLTVLHWLFPADWLQFTAIACLTAAYHYAMRLVLGKISEKYFPQHFDPECFWFRQHAWEPKLYAFLKVRRWKNKLPTAYPEAYDLRKRSLEQIIQNTCQAETVHELIALFSFLPLFFAIIWGQFPVFFITSLCAAGSDLVFAVLQRYNRPRLQKALARRK